MVVEVLPSNVNGHLHCVQLINQCMRDGQPLEVGSIITSMAQRDNKPQVITRIKKESVISLHSVIPARYMQAYNC